MTILAMADLHGMLTVYRQLKHLVVDYAAEAVILAGDLLLGSSDTLSVEEAQGAEARQILEILAALPVPVLYIMGNDDFIELGSHETHVRSIHSRRVVLGDFAFVGYQYGAATAPGADQRRL